VKFFLTFLFVILCGVLSAQEITYDNVYVDYDSAMEYKNLRIIPIRPKHGFGDKAPHVISLSQAVKQGIAVVSERGTASTENVHFLRINNHSDQTIYVSSGEIFSGGRQDRIIAQDTLLEPNGRDQYVSAMCVEELRWSEKEKKFSYQNFANPALRKVLDQSKNQLLIWREISKQLNDNKIPNKSSAYLARIADKQMMQLNDEYYNYFKSKFKSADSSIVGFLCMTGGRVAGSDIYASTDLFFNQLDPLLKGYCDQAVYMGKPLTITREEEKQYMDKLLSDKISQEKFIKENGKIFRQHGQVIHINSF
jgi:ARG and Rhodanese-Phosphatase-superfamily-associated Protein domain